MNTQRLRFISSAEKALNWEVSDEFQFENGTGVGRVHLPLFDIEAGYCAAYASVNQGFFDAARDHNFLLPRNGERISWRGFSISGRGTNQQHRRRPICEACSTELDFRKGRQINVSRESFVESGDGGVREEVLSACSELVKKCLLQPNSKWSLINWSLLVHSLTSLERPSCSNWILTTEKSNQFEIADLSTVDTVDILWGRYATRSNDWVVDASIGSLRNVAKVKTDLRSLFVTYPDTFVHGRLQFVVTGNLGLVPAISTTNSERSIRGIIFPTGWERVAFVSTERGVLVNCELLSKYSSLIGLALLEIGQRGDWFSEDSDIRDIYTAFEFLVNNSSKASDWWQALHEQHPSYLENVLRILQPSGFDRAIWASSQGTYRTLTLTETQVFVSDISLVIDYLIFSDRFLLHVPQDCRLKFKILA